MNSMNNSVDADALGRWLEWGGRLALAALFLPAGIGKLVNLGGVSGLIASKGLPVASGIAIAVAVFEIAAALALLAGWHRRWTALALAAFTLAAAVLFHDFWSLTGGMRMGQQQAFFKNVGIVGGLLLLAARSPRNFPMTTDRKER